MKKITIVFYSVIFWVLGLSVVFNLSAQPKSTKPFGIRKIGFDVLEKHLKNSNDTVFVVNFWATWCKPCVAELPHFQAAYLHFQDKPVAFLMVNLDFPDNYKRVVKFVKARPDFPPAVCLTDTDYNSWINKVEPSWAGDIPATLIYNNPNKYRFFMAGMVSEKQLNGYIMAGLSKK